MQVSDCMRARGSPIDRFQIRRFEIQHQHTGTLPGNGRSNFFVPGNEVHRTKMFGKTDHQSLSSSGVVLIDNGN